VGGYAYNGAGRPIHRVEITLNDGHTWMPAEIHRFEKPNQYGMVYCWVHWTCKVPVKDLRYCTEFAVRAWDDSQNCQPERPTWNLMGMMNNPWFRVKVHEVPGGGAIWFEHPTRVEPNLNHAWDKDRLHLAADGQLPSPGWQQRLQKEYSAAYAPLPLEQQPLDGESYNAKARFLRSEAAPSDKPADKAVPAEDEIEVSPEAISGDGTLVNVGVKMDATVACPNCRQKFMSEAALQIHQKLLCPTATASRVEED
jgi:hypothetical protein